MLTDTSLSSKNDFSLIKWYLDADDEQGNVYIGYHVTLQWRHLELHGYQHVWHTSKNGTQSHGGLTKQPLPVWESNHQLIWQPPHLTATWKSTTDKIVETLYRTDQGEIIWHCTQPKAKAEIHLPHLTFSGWGYTEWLEMTIPVWELPFEHLYWDALSLRTIPWSGFSGKRYITTTYVAQWLSFYRFDDQRYAYQDFGLPTDHG